MINQQLAEIFERMAQMLQFIGSKDPADPFRIRAYTNAALIIREFPHDLAIYSAEGKLKTISGIGAGIAAKIEEFVKTGHMREYDMMKAMLPGGIFELMEIPSLGPKKVKLLHQELGIQHIDDLEQAVKSGKVAALPGFGEKSAEKILDGIRMKKEQKGRLTIGEVFPTVQELVRKLKKIKEVKDAVPAGSFRRAEETIGDIDILVTTKKAENIEADAKKIMSAFVKLSEVKEVLNEGETKASVFTHDGFQVDLRIVKPSQFGSALQYFTGSKKHNVHLRTFAKAKGFKLSEYGFFKGSKLVASATEEDCYRALGMPYIPPELRTDTGEIEAALKNQIPKNLISVEDLCGDLHAHSTYSDGRNSIEEMVRVAQERGYEYIAITDHSPSSRIAGGLSLADLKRKKKEIERLQDTFKIHILFGTEVDILADGSIDYPDEVLRNFDVVVASIHSRFEQDNTDRMLKAMENPHVHIIGHPSGRLIGQRNPYPLDYEKFFKHAVKTGTAVEIDSQFRRLDLQDKYMRQAKSIGVKFSIDSDAHTASSLQLVELGCAWARRGWIERNDIINTLPLKKLRQFFQKKTTK